MTTPRVEVHLPQLTAFVEHLAEKVATGKLQNWPMLAADVRSFFTPPRMDKDNTVIPGWRDMTSFADGATLVHVMIALMALRFCPEYGQASPEQQALLEWIVLFHDLAKVIVDGETGFHARLLIGRHSRRLAPALRLCR